MLNIYTKKEQTEFYTGSETNHLAHVISVSRKLWNTTKLHKSYP